jgi:hypothetical protein
MNAFSKGLSLSNCIQDLTLSNTGLTDSRGINLIRNLKRERIRTLDLSYNPGLTRGFYKCFCNIYLQDERNQLLKLLLEGNKIGDSEVKMICNALVESNSHLSLLNLSKNDI